MCLIKFLDFLWDFFQNFGLDLVHATLNNMGTMGPRPVG